MRSDNDKAEGEEALLGGAAGGKEEKDPGGVDVHTDKDDKPAAVGDSMESGVNGDTQAEDVEEQEVGDTEVEETVESDT